MMARTRDPYTFSNHDALPPIPRDTLATILKSPPTPSTLRALSILFPSTYRT